MIINFKSKAIPYAVALAASMPLSGSVFAQDDAFVLEEIIVTARKVEESLQDVPLSITAFTADDISVRSLEELEDVALYTPGLTFEDYSNGGFGTPIIRGASQLSITALEQNVSTFIDGVYIPRQYALDVGTMDMERIEVVKGPQSALHGANAFMGAINYVTAKADLDEFSADIGVVLGADERQDISGSVSIPLVPGQLAIQLAAAATEYDGDWTNEHPSANAGVSPGTDGNLGGWDSDSFSINLVAQPTDDLNIELAYRTFDVFTETKAQSRLERGSFGRAGDLNCGTTHGSGNLRLYCGELPSTPLAPSTVIGTPSTTPTGFLSDPRSYGLDSQTDILRLAFSAELTEEITMSYQFANIDGEVFSAGQSDRDPVNGQFFGTQINAFTILPVGNFDYDSHELRFEFNGDNGLYAMIGGFYSDGTDYEGGAGAYLGIPGDLEPITAQLLLDNPTLVANAVNVTTITEVQAIFGRVSMPLMDDKLVLSAEGRYTDESKDVDIVYNDLTEAAPYEDTYFTPRVSLDYKLNDDQLIYASVAQGVKSGGLNPEFAGGLEDEEKVYGPDENTTIEIGSKNTFLDGRMQLNAAIYSIDWSNLQASTAKINGGPFDSAHVGNVGSATSQGLELDMTYAVTDALTLNAGLAVIDATYDSGAFSQRVAITNICDDIVCNADGDIDGNDLPRSSDTQWNVGVQYDGAFNNGIDYFLRADVAGQSEQYVSEVNTATIPSRTLTNLRGGVSKDNWSAELWVKNATDEEYVSNAFFIPAGFNVQYVPTWGNKQRIGLTLDYSF